MSSCRRFALITALAVISIAAVVTSVSTRSTRGRLHWIAVPSAAAGSRHRFPSAAAPSAHALPGPRRAVGQFHNSLTVRRRTGKGDAFAIVSITCRLQIGELPHFSTWWWDRRRVRRVQEHAAVSCFHETGVASPVMSITIRMRLLYNPIRSPHGFDYVATAAGGFDQAGGVSTLDGSVSAHCIVGWWQAVAHVQVNFPQGYTPWYGYMDAASPVGEVKRCSKINN